MATSGAIGESEIATAHDGDALGLKVVTHDFGQPGDIEAGAFGRDVTFGSESSQVADPGGGQLGGDADGLYAGQLPHAALELEMEVVDGGLRGVALARKTEGRREDVVGLEAKVDRPHLLKTAEEQA